MPSISIDLPDDLIKRLDKAAKATRQPRDQIIATLLECDLNATALLAKAEEREARIETLLLALSDSVVDQIAETILLGDAEMARSKGE